MPPERFYENRKLIDEINSSCGPFFTESTFFLSHRPPCSFIVSGDKCSKALNRHGNTSEEVNVISWFDDFWVFLELRVPEPNAFISLSIFQGEQSDKEKHQLFRAEWDDYGNLGEKHAQPHWHIVSAHGLERAVNEFIDFEGGDTFLSLLKEEKSRVIDVSRIHFAMNGNWTNGQGHIHKLSDKSIISKWLSGLFADLRVQLTYAKR